MACSWADHCSTEALLLARDGTLQLGAGLEAGALASRDGDARAGLRVATLARAALADAERPKAGDRDILALRQRLLNRVEGGVDHRTNLALRLIGLLRDFFAQVALPHRMSSISAPAPPQALTWCGSQRTRHATACRICAYVCPILLAAVKCSWRIAAVRPRTK